MLKQHSTELSRIEYKEVKSMYAYLGEIKGEFIYYSRLLLRLDLPFVDNLITLTDISN